ncbi:ABC transporter substrate-binding protein [Aureimonas leprariae]|nr:extracellular solute-binding protein [Aureimonas leprariae]
MSTLLGGAALLSAATLPGAAEAQDGKPLAGKSITVLLPAPGYPAEVISRFQDETGAKVDQQTLAWDQLRNRIVTALVAGSAPADVIELDWSWVGQFGAAGWLSPLDEPLAKAGLDDMPLAPIFKYDGATVGAPYNADFKLMIYNKDQLARAGIAKPPQTLDELVAAGKALQEKGVAQHPLGWPLSVGEATSTAWFLTTMMFGGDIFDAEGKPAFTDPQSPGYKALAFIKQAVDDGLIDPASTAYGNPEVREAFKRGDATFTLSDGPGLLPDVNDPAKSKVAGQAAGGVVPTVSGQTRSFGLPEALAIPKTSGEQDAAAAFIAFVAEPDAQIASYAQSGTMPTRTAAIEMLNKDGKLLSGDAILAQLKGVGPLFADGTPAWYPAFSNGTAGAINQLVKGEITVDQAAKAIAEAADAAKTEN